MIYHIAARNPNNTVRWMCAEITRKLHQWGHAGRVYIGGDATSRKEDVKQEKGHDLFKLIASELREFKPEYKLDFSNPSVKTSFEFFNDILSNNIEELTYGVDKACGLVIQDYENCKEDKNGKIDKTPIRDPVTKVSYQPYGHYCFVGETLIQTFTGKKRIDEIKINDLVLTRKGYKRVIKIHDNGYKKIKHYKVGETVIKCTPSHRVFTVNKKFIKIDSLLMQYAIFCIFVKNKICKEKRFVTTVETSIDTQNQKNDQKTPIIQDGYLLMGKRKRLGYIFINGFVNEAKYLMDLLYTTLRIHLIMTFQILNVKKEAIINPTILRTDLKTIQNGQKNFTVRGLPLLPNGINQKRVENGIASKCQRFGKLKRQKYIFAYNAEKNIQQDTLEYQNTATQIVRQQHLEEEGELRHVYDLSIEEVNEYFANGILFHNCDLTRYFICKVFAKEYEHFQNRFTQLTPGGVSQQSRVGKFTF